MHLMYVALNEMTQQTSAWLYGVHRMCIKITAISSGTSHVTTKQCYKYTTLVDNQHILCKPVQPLVQSCMEQESSESAQKQRTVQYRK